jgi:hypothetical protein
VVLRMFSVMFAIHMQQIVHESLLATAGVAWGCRWVFEDNGVWKETCYCEDRDGCNAASVRLPFAVPALLILSIVTVLINRVFFMH